MRRFLLPPTLALALAVTFAGAAGAADSVGIDRLEAKDPVTGQPAEAITWYPTETEPARLQVGPYFVDAANEGAVPAELRGLIVISHGSGGGQLSHLDTAMALAKAGYLVATPRHPGDSASDDGAAGSWRVMAGRPQTISAVIDAALTDPRYKEPLAGAKVGVVGYGAGGYTALTLVGARPDLHNVVDHCAANPEDGYCGLAEAERSGQDMNRPLGNLQDRRIEAAAILAPKTAAFSDTAFATIRIPILVYRAEQDGMLRFPLHADRLRRLLPTAPEYRVAGGAGHDAFLTPMQAEETDGVAQTASGDPPGFDRAAFHTALNVELAAFFDLTLR